MLVLALMFVFMLIKRHTSPSHSLSRAHTHLHSHEQMWRSDTRNLKLKFPHGKSQGISHSEINGKTKSKHNHKLDVWDVCSTTLWSWRSGSLSLSLSHITTNTNHLLFAWFNLFGRICEFPLIPNIILLLAEGWNYALRVLGIVLSSS